MLRHRLDPLEFDNRESFRETYRIGAEQTDSVARVEALQKILATRMLRRLKDDVTKLPQKEETIIWVTLTAAQKRIYRALVEQNMSVLVGGQRGSQVGNLRNVAMELRKVCNHPLLINNAEGLLVDGSVTVDSDECALPRTTLPRPA